MLADTTTTLAPLVDVLDRFTHRNKNQHSHSHWWSAVRVLRRQLRNLMRITDEGNLRKSAQWISSKLLPRCYLQFSQLAADNQYATLGLFLIALLADLKSILEPFCPDLSHPVVGMETRAPAPVVAVQNGEKVDFHTRSSRTTNTGILDDRGTLVSRAQRSETSAGTGRVSGQDTSRGSRTSSTMTDLPLGLAKEKVKKKSKSQKKKHDALSDLFGSL